MADLAALGEIIGEAFRIAGEAIAAVSGILDDLVTAVQDAIDAIAQVPGVELISDIIGNVGKVIAGEADKSGEATGKAYATGIKRSGQAITQAMRAALGESARILRAASPPGPESPLHEIDVWGRTTGEAYSEGSAAGLVGGIPKVPAALNQIGSVVGMTLDQITTQAHANIQDWYGNLSPGAQRRAEASGDDIRLYFESKI